MKESTKRIPTRDASAGTGSTSTAFVAVATALTLALAAGLRTLAQADDDRDFARSSGGSGALSGDPGAWAGAGLLVLHPDADSFNGVVGGADRTPEPTTVPVPVVPAETPAEVVPVTPLEALICSKDWDCGTALRITRCESRHDPGAVGNGSYGLWQVQASVWAPFFGGFWETWMDPVVNTEMAWVIYQRAGYSWHPWACW